MFNNSRFLAVVCFLLMVLSISTPATFAQDKSPVIFSVERRSTGEVLLRAIVVAAPCTGRYVVHNTLTGRPMDLSEMRTGEVRTFPTGWFARPGEFTLFFIESESVPSFSCPSWKGGKLDNLSITFNSEGKLDNNRRLPGMYIGDNGKTNVRIVVDENLRAPNELRFLFRFPQGGQTQLYVFQLFPNDTSSVLEDIVSAPSPTGFGYSVIGFPLARMTTRLPILFVAVRDGVSTSGVVYTP